MPIGVDIFSGAGGLSLGAEMAGYGRRPPGEKFGGDSGRFRRGRGGSVTGGYGRSRRNGL